jgi:hypothetical protein
MCSRHCHEPIPNRRLISMIVLGVTLLATLGLGFGFVTSHAVHTFRSRPSMMQRVARRCSELLIKDPMLNSPIALIKPTFHRGRSQRAARRGGVRLRAPDAGARRGRGPGQALRDAQPRPAEAGRQGPRAGAGPARARARRAGADFAGLAAQTQRSNVQRSRARQLYLARELVVLDAAESFVEA